MEGQDSGQTEKQSLLDPHEERFLKERKLFDTGVRCHERRSPEKASCLRWRWTCDGESFRSVVCFSQERRPHSHSMSIRESRKSAEVR
jgi:hypothetical protein